MKNMYIGLLILLTMTVVANAAVIDGVSVTASSEITESMNSYTGYRFDGHAVNIVNGSGFQEETGCHVTDGIYRGQYQYDVQTLCNPSGDGEIGDPYGGIVTEEDIFGGNIWAAPIDPNPNLVFDLGSPQTLTEIKIWNANNHWTQLAKDAEGTFNLDRLGMGVKTLDITLLASDGTTVLGTYLNVTLDRAPGRDDVDFGQVIDVVDTAGVQFVRFDNFTNYGDAPFNQVGLSEVRFYNDQFQMEVTAAVLDDGVVRSIDDNTDDVILWLADANEITMNGSVNIPSPDWTYWVSNVQAVRSRDDDCDGIVDRYIDFEPSYIVADANSLNTTVKFYTPGTYRFTLGASDGVSQVKYDSVCVKVIDPNDDPSGLIAHYTFDEGTGTLAEDEVTKVADPGARDIDLEPGTAPAGRFGWSSDAAVGGYALDCATGINGWTDIPLAQNYFDNTKFAPSRMATVSFWMKTSTYQSYLGTILTSYTWELMQRGNSIELLVQCPPFTGPFAYWIKAQTNVDDGKWHFITFTYDWLNGECRLYVDSRLEGRLLMASDTLPTYLTSFASAGHGIDLAGSGSQNGYFYKGLIDDLKIYQIPLTEAQVRAAYEAHSNPAIEENPCVSLDLLFADINGDCEVGLADFVEMAGNWLN